MPEDIKVTRIQEPAAPGEKPPEAAKQLNPADRRKAMQELMQEAGYSMGGGPPSPAVLQKMQELAKAKGIELPERMLGGGRAGGGDAPVFREVYRLPGGDVPGAVPELQRVRIGITDGANTEILSGDLKEGDVIITGVNQASAFGAPTGGASPFGRGPGGR